ncbi:probable ATP-dependent RNA helicase DDX10 [Gouania willdenowi]|uniref:ATP-dependent RNA helicase n=1 Tax=Gouania willdenowi TaxID=441366 RepID=A0A8C5GX71_GOUWI|nr:probable ATP-dependent RNA helicase DDX10 [Gouania willdenowi]
MKPKHVPPGKDSGPSLAQDPVRSFEKWKKKYSRTKERVKRDCADRKRPAWQVERDDIRRLVSGYERIDAEKVVQFSDFPLSKKTLLGLQDSQLRQPTEVQRRTIGLALRGCDVLGAAKTGSGKTLAFLIPVLECLYRQQWSSMDGLGALIISPTRELAYQTYEVLRKVGRNHDFSAGLVIGGKDLDTESERINRTNIIICTPGRLLQHMDQTAAFTASNLQLLVLDEADRILDLGFADTLNAIVENLPRSRQTLLFSATQTKSVKDLARLSLREPQYVWVHEKARFSTPATLEQSFVVCELHQKVNMLFSFIRSHLKKKIIVFFACCKEVQYLFRAFCRLRPGTSVLALHGKQHQMKRVEIYNDFIRKSSAVLLATDIAARGLDFPSVHWVLQFDCPEDADTYIHRVGRTARYRQGGEGLLLLLPSEEKGMIKMLKDKKVPINKITVNPDKLQDIGQKLQAFLAQEKEQKERAQRCFVSYLRSVFLMKNKDVFDVTRLPIQEYAHSLGLAVPPRVRFLNKAPTHKITEKGEEEELRKFKAKLGGKVSSSGSDDSSDDDNVERESEAEERQPEVIVMGAEDSSDDDDDDDDLRDLDLLTVKRKDVLNVTGDQQEEEEPAGGGQKTERVTKYKEAKKVLKRNFLVNTKVTFTDEGTAVQLWPPVQRTAALEEEEEDEGEASGINVEKARERLRREDQAFDKQEYSRKVKAKHREKRLKERDARREAAKRHSPASDQEDEVLAYLANHSDSDDEEEFDPSTLPDPDKLHSEEEEEEEGDDEEEEEEGDDEEEEEEGDDEEEEQGMRPSKRQHRSESSDEEELVMEKKKKRNHEGEEEEEDEDHSALDTGLTLAEDEELVLHLLAGKT